MGLVIPGGLKARPGIQSRKSAGFAQSPSLRAKRSNPGQRCGTGLLRRLRLLAMTAVIPIARFAGINTQPIKRIPYDFGRPPKSADAVAIRAADLHVKRAFAPVMARRFAEADDDVAQARRL
ncbi:hypothetical protein SS37A_01860 [Methylocystis iwaonis]|uniref:Uncharacterized protein n=1 Tax=Methylocystis iwaonis TaxID=2885079 RepID=A0ABN6VET3_9HYPH|nr:hypothetical protein SS37A_01860 [Methylocystis iwaonis]